MFKYMNEIRVGYGSMFFTDNDHLCYNLEEAIHNTSESFAIINPLASGKIDNYKGKIWRTYEDFSPYAKVRKIFISPDIRTRLLRECFEITVNNKKIFATYDYEFLFNDRIPNLVGEKIMDHGVEKTLTIRPLVLPYRTYASPREYLYSEFEANRDIDAGYAFVEETWWEDYDPRILLRKVNLYRKNHGLPKLEMLKGTD